MPNVHMRQTSIYRLLQKKVDFVKVSIAFDDDDDDDNNNKTSGSFSLEHSNNICYFSHTLEFRRTFTLLHDFIYEKLEEEAIICFNTIDTL